MPNSAPDLQTQHVAAASAAKAARQKVVENEARIGALAAAIPKLERRVADIQADYDDALTEHSEREDAAIDLRRALSDAEDASAEIAEKVTAQARLEELVRQEQIAEALRVEAEKSKTLEGRVAILEAQNT